MDFMCLPLNGTPAFKFYHRFTVNSLLSFLSIGRVFLCVSGEFRALCSSRVPRCGAPEFHHEFPAGSPITFLYIPHMSACISLICFRYLIPPSIILVWYPLFVIRLLVKQQTRENTRIEFYIRKTERQKLNALPFLVFLSCKIHLINVLCVLIICQLIFYKDAPLSARYCKSKIEKNPLPFWAFALYMWVIPIYSARKILFFML